MQHSIRKAAPREFATELGQRIQYNFVKPHEALDGKTPTEAANIKIEGRNKWLTIIQNASSKN